MAKYPGASWRPLAGGHQPAMQKHDIVCLHTMVGNLAGTDAMFKRNGWSGTESHFGVGGKWGADGDRGLDGKVYQWTDTAHRADANLDGNPRVISIETADNAPGLVRDIQDWTPKQLDAIVKIVTWACKTYDIPAVLIADSKPGRRGIGYHRQGCEHSLGVGRVPGFLVKGGERWSTSTGKECPGPRRIAQLQSIVIPRVKEALKPKPPVVVKPPAPAPIKEPAVVAKTPLTTDWTVKLTTQFQVDTMNLSQPKTPWKIGDTLDLRRIVLWGGPHAEKNADQVRKVLAGQDVIVKMLAEQALQQTRIENALAELDAKMFPPTPTEPDPAVRTV